MFCQQCKLKNNKSITHYLFVIPIAILVLVSFTFSLYPLSFAFAQSFGTPINLSNTDKGSIDSILFSLGKNVYAVWKDGCEADPNEDRINCNNILFRASVDGGATFDNIVNLKIATNGLAEHLQIAAIKNNVYAVWDDNSKGNQEIFFRASFDNGRTFGNVIDLSNNNGISGVPKVAASEDNVYVVWQDNTPGNNDLFFKQSNDRGKTFSKTINLSNNEGDSGFQQIAAFGNNVYVMWQDNTENTEILFKQSSNAGKKFGETINISQTPKQSFIPMLTANGKNVYIFWQEVLPDTTETMLRTSEDGGKTFGSPINLNDFGIGSLVGIKAVSNDKLYGISFSTSGLPVIFIKSEDGGKTFGKNNIQDVNSPFDHPSVAIFAERIALVWGEYGSAFLKFSSDGGKTFGKNISLSEIGVLGTQGIGLDLSLKKIYLTYADKSDPETSEIFFASGQ